MIFWVEMPYHFTVSVRDYVHVNASTPAGIEMEFDITFPEVPCALLAVDAEDPTGQSQSLHLDRTHRVWKHRLDKTGSLIGKKSRFEMGDTVRTVNQLEEIGGKIGLENVNKDGQSAAAADEEEYEEECGSCYGAGEEGECCNTCDDVKRAYQRKGWLFEHEMEVRQCRKIISSADEKEEGCNVHGIVALSSGGGNLHLTPGRELENFGQKKKNQDFLTSLAEFISNSFEQFNVSHTVNKLRFGTQDFPGHIHQLDGERRMIQDAYGMYQYYVQIVPTLYRYLNGTEIQTNQYSVTEHMRHVQPTSNRGLPGVFFFYEVSPLHVEIEEYRVGWVQFSTTICAVIGGVFTVMGMADQFIFSRTRKYNTLG